MITLPPGFDYQVLLSDYWSISLPFVSVAFLFSVYRLIVKAIRG